jgi:hypothetical protein
MTALAGEARPGPVPKTPFGPPAALVNKALSSQQRGAGKNRIFRRKPPKDGEDGQAKPDPDPDAEDLTNPA